jgi:CRP-like cAMP-binding protein
MMTENQYRKAQGATMPLKGERAEVADRLKSIPIFRSLSPRNLQLLCGLLSRREVVKGEALYREGQPCERFIIVVEGRFNVLKTSTDGREKIVNEIQPFQHFGLAEIITSRRSGATVEATGPATVLTLSKDDFGQTMLDNPKMCLQLMQTMAGTIMDLSDQIQEVSFERVSVRLARLLVLLADRDGSWVDGHLLIRNRYSHQELSRRLGTSRETVTRMLKRFKDMGLISMEGRQLIVLDRDGLVDVVDRGGIENDPI